MPAELVHDVVREPDLALRRDEVPLRSNGLKLCWVLNDSSKGLFRSGPDEEVGSDLAEDGAREGGG